MKRVRGFTLIELMVVVAIIAILAGMALTAYNKQIRKSRRAEAKLALSDMAFKQEKYRVNHTTFGTCNQVAGPDPASTTACATYNGTLKNYNVAVTTNTATQFTMTATPKTTDQLKDSCGMLTLDSNAGTVSKSPTTPGCWQ